MTEWSSATTTPPHGYHTLFPLLALCVCVFMCKAHKKLAEDRMEDGLEGRGLRREGTIGPTWAECVGQEEHCLTFLHQY